MKPAKLTWMAVLIALTVVGASIKIPAVIGSVALDSLPAIIAAALLGGGPGAIVGALGHLVSAYFGGMPLGAMHLLIALEMAVLSFLFGVVYKQGKTWNAALLFIIGNSLIAPIPFIFLISMEFFVSMLPSLIVGAVLNTVLGLLIAPRLISVMKPALVGRKL